MLKDMRLSLSGIAAAVLAFLVLLPAGVMAQTPPPPASSQEPLKPEELEALVAPIALYPDALLAEVLMAATYPLEVVQADRWSAAAWPVVARAQQGALPVIGYLSPTTAGSPYIAAFRKGLNEVGFIEGRNIAIEYRFANNAPDRLAELAADRCWPFQQTFCSGVAYELSWLDFDACTLRLGEQLHRHSPGAVGPASAGRGIEPGRHIDRQSHQDTKNGCLAGSVTLRNPACLRVVRHCPWSCRSCGDSRHRPSPATGQGQTRAVDRSWSPTMAL
jgi:hypothetical protein